MSDREERLRSLLNKVRAKRPDERTTRAADALDRIRTASGTTASAGTQSSRPVPKQASQPARPVSSQPARPVSSQPARPVSSQPARPVSSQPARPVSSQPARPAASTAPVPSSFPTQLPASPLPEPPTSPSLDSPTRYSSQPPRVERPLSVEPRAQSIRPSAPTIVRQRIHGHGCRGMGKQHASTRLAAGRIRRSLVLRGGPARRRRPRNPSHRVAAHRPNAPSLPAHRDG